MEAIIIWLWRVAMLGRMAEAVLRALRNPQIGMA